jgi:hypothetical protein
MAAEVFVRSIKDEVNRICIPSLAEDPFDCAKHEHMPGARRLVVEVDALCRSDEDESTWRSLVGQVVPLNAAQNARLGAGELLLSGSAAEAALARAQRVTQRHDEGAGAGVEQEHQVVEVQLRDRLAAGEVGDDDAAHEDPAG